MVCFFLLGYQFLYKRKVARVVYFTLFSLYFFYKACGFYFLFILLSTLRLDFALSLWTGAVGEFLKKVE